VFSTLKTLATEIVIPLGKLAFETLVALGEAIAPVAEKWIPILKDAFVGIASAIAGTVTTAFEGIKAVIESVMSFIESAVDRAMAAYNTIKGFTDGIKEGALAIGNKAAEMGGAVIDAGGELLTDIKDKGKGWYNYLTSPFAQAEEEVVGNSIVPDMVNAIGDWMNMLPNKMALPAQFAADGVVDAMNRMSQSIMNMGAMSSQSGFTSPVSGIGASAGPVSSNVNFNISGVNLNNDRITPDMKKYVEGVAIKVANQVLRQQTNFGGLI
jgi:phage-related protein